MNPHQIRKPPEERTIEEQLQIALDFIASIGRGPSLGETIMGWMDNKIMEAKYWPNVPLPSDVRTLVDAVLRERNVATFDVREAEDAADAVDRALLVFTK